MDFFELARFAALYPNAMVRTKIGAGLFRDHALCAFRSLRDGGVVERIPAPVKYDGVPCSVCGGGLPGEVIGGDSRDDEQFAATVPRKIAIAMQNEPPVAMRDPRRMSTMPKLPGCPATHKPNTPYRKE